MLFLSVHVVGFLEGPPPPRQGLARMSESCPFRPRQHVSTLVWCRLQRILQCCRLAVGFSK
eukprot:7555136-Lingulodinium_polyedra.AAC.1